MLDTIRAGKMTKDLAICVHNTTKARPILGICTEHVCVLQAAAFSMTSRYRIACSNRGQHECTGNPHRHLQNKPASKPASSVCISSARHVSMGAV